MFLQLLQVLNALLQLLGVNLKVIFLEKVSETASLAHVNGHEFVVLEFEAFLSGLQVLSHEEFVRGLATIFVHVISDDDLEEKEESQLNHLNLLNLC